MDILKQEYKELGDLATHQKEAALIFDKASKRAEEVNAGFVALTASPHSTTLRHIEIEKIRAKIYINRADLLGEIYHAIEKQVGCAKRRAEKASLSDKEVLDEKRFESEEKLVVETFNTLTDSIRKFENRFDVFNNAYNTLVAAIKDKNPVLIAAAVESCKTAHKIAMLFYKICMLAKEPFHIADHQLLRAEQGLGNTKEVNGALSDFATQYREANKRCADYLKSSTSQAYDIAVESIDQAISLKEPFWIADKEAEITMRGITTPKNVKMAVINNKKLVAISKEKHTEYLNNPNESTQEAALNARTDAVRSKDAYWGDPIIKSITNIIILSDGRIEDRRGLDTPASVQTAVSRNRNMVSGV
jgi:hypothetical protein